MPMRFQKGGERSEIGGVHGMGINESNAHVAAELASLGVIQTFSFAARNAIARGELVPVLLAWQPDPCPLFLVYPPDRHMSQRLRVFIEWATQRFAHKFDRATYPSSRRTKIQQYALKELDVLLHLFIHQFESR
jgi:LysR family transcriptional regulator, regulator for bpeEF and oprC